MADDLIDILQCHVTPNRDLPGGIGLRAVRRPVTTPDCDITAAGLSNNSSTSSDGMQAYEGMQSWIR